MRVCVCGGSLAVGLRAGVNWVAQVWLLPPLLALTALSLPAVLYIPPCSFSPCPPLSTCATDEWFSKGKLSGSGRVHVASAACCHSSYLFIHFFFCSLLPRFRRRLVRNSHPCTTALLTRRASLSPQRSRPQNA